MVNSSLMTHEWCKSKQPKVIAQQDQIDFSSLTEEEQKEIGWFDIEKFSKEASKKKVKLIYGERINNGDIDEYVKTGGLVIVTCGEPLYKEGFQKAQELLSDRVFTLEDVVKIVHMWDNHIIIYEEDKGSFSAIEKFIQSRFQPKSWKIEVEMRQECPYDFTSRCTMDRCDCVKTPKFTNGKLKILKI